MKKQRGITLIALVITIIVLLILAGVSLTLILGDNGILNKAKTGAETHRTTSEEEQILLGYTAYKTAKLGGEDSPIFKVEGANAEGDDTTGWIVTFGNTNGGTGNLYKVSSNGTIKGPFRSLEEIPFDAEEWDKTAASEDCFIWASDDPNSAEYGMIVGYTENVQNYTKLRYPSRTTKIAFNDWQYKNRFNGISSDASRGFTKNIISIEIPETVNSIEGYAFACYNANSTFCNLREVETNAKNIGNDSFHSCRLSEISFGKNTTSLGNGAFYDCDNLTEITIPDHITNIGTGIFDRCDNLETVVLPQNIAALPNDMFRDCKKLDNIRIPNNVTMLGERCFAGCSTLTSIEIPEKVKNIGTECFSGCSNLNNVEFPSNLERIGPQAFWGCTNMTNINVPENVSYIGGSAFDYTNWYNNQPNGLVYINNILYKYKSTSPQYIDIIIRDGTICISGGAFYGKNTLKSIQIPNTVKIIDSTAFVNCHGISEIIIPSSVVEMGSRVFGSWESNQTIKFVIDSKPNNWPSTYLYQFYDDFRAEVIWGYTGE